MTTSVSKRAGSELEDRFSRVHDYLRVSVTDRCNLRCGYCMPPEGIEPFAKELILDYEELLRVVRVGVSLGIRKLRITGGEPFVRSGLISFLQQVFRLDNLEKIGLTTNGLLLESRLEELQDTRVNHLNISLDSLDPERFRRVTRGGSVQRVLSAVRKSVNLGFHVKINVVALHDLSENEIETFLQLARELDVEVRFIEYMPLDGSGWDRDRFQPLSELKERVLNKFNLRPIGEDGGVATSFRMPSNRGRVGFIASLSEPFCDTCSRLRLSSTGVLYSCLFSPSGVHLLPVLRSGGSDEEIAEKYRETVERKWEGNPSYTGEWNPERESPPGHFALIRSIGG